MPDKINTAKIKEIKGWLKKHNKLKLITVDKVFKTVYTISLRGKSDLAQLVNMALILQVGAAGLL